jgi:hypothetical protein
MEGSGESAVFRSPEHATSITVLFVDDDRDYLAAIKRALEGRRPNLTIETKTTPGDALDRVETAATIDCVVTDYRMPDRDGLWLLEQVREHDPELPVLLLTGRGSESIASEAISAGVTDYLPKRGDEDGELKLLNRIETAVDQYHSVTALKESETRYRRLVEQSPNPIAVLREEAVVYANQALVELFGAQGRERLLGQDPTDLVEPSDRPTVWERIGTVIDGDQEISRGEGTITRLDGETRIVESAASPIEFDGEPAVQVVLRDVTERKRRERRLAEFERAVERAGHPVFFVNRAEEIEYVNPAFEELTGYTESEAVGESKDILNAPETDLATYEEMRQAACNGEVWEGTVVYQRKSGHNYDARQTVAPIVDDAGEIEKVVVIQTDITERKQRERTLERQRDELKTLNRINDLVLEITTELVESSNRDRIEATVCERLAQSPLYEVAWIGEPLPGKQGWTTRARAGGEASPGDSGAENPDPIVALASRALETGEVAVQQTTAPTGSETGDRDNRSQTGAAAAIPLGYHDALFGVLGVRALHGHAFTEQKIAALETLGKTVGFAIDAIKNRRLLFADEVTELEVDVTGAALPLVELSRALECQLSMDGFVASDEGENVPLYLEVRDSPATTFVERAREKPLVESATVVADEPENSRVQVTLAPGACLPVVTRHQLGLKDVELDAGTGRVVLDLPPSVDVREVVSEIQESFSRVDFVAKRERERRITRPADIADVADERLTDRQHEVLKTAFLAGYFDWPRESTAEEVAAMVGISAATFHHHLRHAEGAVVKTLFERPE